MTSPLTPRPLRAAAPLVAVVTLLAGAAVSLPAQAGVSWSVGISAPLAPGVQIGTVIGSGHHHHRPRVAAYVPAPVVYAPPPVAYLPPPVYAAPVYAPPVYAPPVYAAPVVMAPRPVVYAPPVVVRPRYPVYAPVRPAYRAPVIVRPGHGYVDGRGHGGGGRPVPYEPMARVSDRPLR